MNNYKYLIFFVQKTKSLTANSIFHQLVWWRHQCWRHPISVKRCLHYRGTVVQKRLAIGRGEKILDQKNRGWVQRNPLPPASLRVKEVNLTSQVEQIWFLYSPKPLNCLQTFLIFPLFFFELLLLSFFLTVKLQNIWNIWVFYVLQ